MKRTMTFSKAVFGNRGRFLRREGKRDWAVWRESIDEATFSNQTGSQGIKYEKVLLLKGKKS